MMTVWATVERIIAWSLGRRKMEARFRTVWFVLGCHLSEGSGTQSTQETQETQETQTWRIGLDLRGLEGVPLLGRKDLDLGGLRWWERETAAGRGSVRRGDGSLAKG